MAHRMRIENLPQDAMKEIMLRVAKPPEGASDIAKLFTVSKSFLHFSDDRDVLKAVSFIELFTRYWIRYPNVLGLFEQLLEVGGLVARSAKAGNTDAQFLMSKVVMICASTLLNTHLVILSPSAGNKYFLDLARTSDFITNFSDRNMYYDMVKLFLSRAELKEVKQMKEYLEDFVAYFLEPGKEADFLQFLACLSKFCEMESLPLLFDSLACFVERFNHLCVTGNNTMQEIGCSEELRHPLLQSLVEMDDNVEHDMLMKRLDTVAPVLKVGWENVSDRDMDDDIRVTIDGLLFLVSVLRRDLERRARIGNARTQLMSKFLVHS